MDEQLKPCPFCGSNDIIIWDNPPEEQHPMQHWAVKCRICSAAIDGYRTRDIAIQTWNDRSTSRPVANKAEVYAAITRERAFQDWKWGPLAVNSHTIAEWLMIMESELFEAKLAWTDNAEPESILQEILQVAAVAVACLEQYGPTERKYPEDMQNKSKPPGWMGDYGGPGCDPVDIDYQEQE